MDLTVYRISDPDYILKEDGYQFKYPFTKNSSDEYFLNEKYKNDIDRVIASAGSAEPYGYIDFDGNEITLRKTGLPFLDWIDSSAGEYATTNTKDKLMKYASIGIMPHQEGFRKTCTYCISIFLLVLLHIIFMKTGFR